MMNFTSSEIESIVRVVLQRLRAEDLRANESMPRHENSTEHLVTQESSPSRSFKEMFAVDRECTLGSLPANGSSPRTALSLNEPVVTLELLRGKLDGVQTIRVPNRAIVTPAVVDELRDRKITLDKTLNASAGVTRGNHSGTCGDRRLLVLACQRSKPELASLGEFTSVSNNCVADVCRIAGHLNSSGKVVVWSTATPYAASRAAAGNSILHAIQLSQLSDFDRALREADPNVVIVDNSIWSLTDTRQLAEQWLGRLK